MASNILATYGAALMVAASAAPVSGQDGKVAPLPDPQLPAPDETIPEQLYPCNPGGYEPEPGAVPDVPAAIDCGEVIVPDRKSVV